MSVSHKNIFFDKRMPEVTFDEQPAAPETSAASGSPAQRPEP
jgi:hypothetical protein